MVRDTVQPFAGDAIETMDIVNDKCSSNCRDYLGDEP